MVSLNLEGLASGYARDAAPLDTAPTDFAPSLREVGASAPVELASATFSIDGPRPGYYHYLAGGVSNLSVRFDPEALITPEQIRAQGFQHAMSLGLPAGDDVRSAMSSATAAGFAQALSEMTGATVLAIRTTNSGLGDAGAAGIGPIGAGNETQFLQYDFHIGGMSKDDFMRRFGEAGGLARAQELARENVEQAGDEWLPDFFTDGALGAAILRLLSELTRNMRLNWAF